MNSIATAGMDAQVDSRPGAALHMRPLFGSRDELNFFRVDHGSSRHLPFHAQSETLVEDCLRRLGEISELDEEREIFVFTSKPGAPEFRSQCAIVQGGIDSQQSGDYSSFLGRLVEGLAAEFGKITIENRD